MRAYSSELFLTMTGNTSVVKGYYELIFLTISDGRTNNWLLMYDPLGILIILALYLYFVTSLGPKLLKNKKAFEMKNTLLIYNFLQMFVSIYVFVMCIEVGWFTRFSWKCEPIDYSDDPRNIRIARIFHVYFLLKISELLETVFFVLRKKNNQISFLHLYHHTSMVVMGWTAVKYIPGGHQMFIGVANTFVHVIMYSYYLLSTLGPKYQKYLWWKKYLTTLQLVQFVLVFLHALQLLFYDCGFPKWPLLLTLPNAIFFYYLFKEFYTKNYAKSDQNKNVQVGFLKSEKMN